MGGNVCCVDERKQVGSVVVVNNMENEGRAYCERERDRVGESWREPDPDWDCLIALSAQSTAVVPILLQTPLWSQKNQTQTIMPSRQKEVKTRHRQNLFAVCVSVCFLSRPRHCGVSVNTHTCALCCCIIVSLDNEHERWRLGGLAKKNTNRLTERDATTAATAATAATAEWDRGLALHPSEGVTL